MNRHSLATISALAVALLCGCAVGPDYERPNFEIDNNWSKKGLDKESQNVADWWKIFGDEQLNSLVARALENNYSIATARARIQQARATLGVSTSGLFPTLDGSGSYTESGRLASGYGRSAYNIGAKASWEIDVFGGTRRDIESKAADYASSLANEAAARIAVAAEVAKNYMNYRCVQEELVITQRNLETQKRTLEVTSRKHKNGFVSEYDVRRSEAQVGSTAAEIPALQRELNQTRYAIEYLLGLQTGALEEELKDFKPLPMIEDFTPEASVPASLLKRRPDVISAEFALKSAVARIGAARADYYPRFFISGNIYYDAGNTASMFNANTGNWSAGPSVSWNIFSAGKTYYNVKYAESAAREAGLAWESTVLNAIKEVEDAMTALGRERERMKLLESVVESNKRALELSKELEENGEIEFLDLLETQRTLLSSEQNCAISRMNFVSYITDFYLALGGGWNSEEYFQDAPDDNVQEGAKKAPTLEAKPDALPMCDIEPYDKDNLRPDAKLAAQDEK